MFVADDLGAWLVALLADAGRKRLVATVVGSEQQRALHQAATAAITATTQELSPADGERARRVAMVVSEVFKGIPYAAAQTGRQTLLELLQAGIAGQLAVLDDASLTGTGRSSAELLGLSGEAVAQALAARLLGEIVLRARAACRWHRWQTSYLKYK